MNGLLSNARRAFLRPAIQRESPPTRSRIIGAILPVTIASTIAGNRTSFTTISVYSATAQCCRMRGATSRPFGWHVLRHSSPARMQEETPKPGEGRKEVVPDTHTASGLGGVQWDTVGVGIIAHT